MLKKLTLYHFRNYEQVEFSFSDSINWITGKNAQGKTNLLEAIYLITTGRSFRTTQLPQLIKKDEPSFYLKAEIEKEGVNQTIQITYSPELKKVQYNATTYSQLTPLIGLIPHVVYAPEDLALMNGAPAFRRKFLDLHLSQTDPLYLHHLIRYHKAVRHRNALLKKKDLETIESWEHTMAHSATYLIQKRAQMIEELKEPLNHQVHILSSEEDEIDISYQHSLAPMSQEDLAAQWGKSRSKEVMFGTTLSGPHRDDVLFSIGGLSTKSFASEGQKHTVLAALRLTQWQHLKERTGQMPILSIDDFGSHLDRRRQENFEKALRDLGQIFLTSPHMREEIFSSKEVQEIEANAFLKA